MIKCIAVDDEPLALELMESYISQVPGLELMETFSDAISAWGFLQKNPVDLVFLDIQMPDITGIQLAKSMNHRQPMIIFTTAYSKYAVDGFSVDAVDYLLKPFDFNRFLEAINKAKNYKTLSDVTVNPSDDAAIFVKSDYQNLRISTREILFIEGFDDYIRIHLDSGKSIFTLMSLKCILEKLPERDFLRVHRSYIVPVRKIQRIYNQHIQLVDKEIPIGKSYIDSVKKALNLKK
ncbi:MAG: LytTR family DNA-binding domain-containing protein [Bacteroidales bacterium]|nr:LytTR family DNA-binding domain-containing protein [Bacteroidales bacterium]MDD4712634.1 LytTR family DNA-binding domain-containing protein [Bacteroidales bacterium]